MKKLISAVALVCVAALPMLSVTSANAAETRAQVRADLVQVEQAGYQPGASALQYPADIQTADARIATNTVASPMSQGSAAVHVAHGSSHHTVSSSNARDSIYFGD